MEVIIGSSDLQEEDVHCWIISIHSTECSRAIYKAEYFICYASFFCSFILCEICGTHVLSTGSAWLPPGWFFQQQLGSDATNRLVLTFAQAKLFDYLCGACQTHLQPWMGFSETMIHLVLFTHLFLQYLFGYTYYKLLMFVCSSVLHYTWFVMANW